MGTLRYVRTLDQVRKAQEENPEFAQASLQSVRLVYETDPEIYEALVPQPLESIGRPEVCIDITAITMHLPHGDMQFGSAFVGIKTLYEGQEGIFLITMPMSTEAAVIGGRETFGEPKKLADVSLVRDGNQLTGSISRIGIPYVEFSGRLGKERGGHKETVHAFCYKAIPSCDQGKAFDYDPLLIRLDWKMDYDNVWDVDKSELILNDSPLDPVADIPVRRLVSVEYDEGRSASNGTVLRSVPEEWVLPFLHQRYDDPSGLGIEI